MSFFGKNIKQLRQARDLSQQQFANLFELSRASIGSYEEGRADPKIETLVKIARYFDLTIDDLVCKKLGSSSLEQESIKESPVEEQKSKTPYIEDRLSELERRFISLEKQINKSE